MNTERSAVRSNRAFRRTTSFFGLAFLVVPLLLAGCSKKDDPNVSYDSEGGSGSGSGYSESDIDGSGKTYASSTSTNMQIVYFEYDSANLTEQAKNALKNNVSYLKSNEKLDVTVEGHCDERGSTEYNLALGERRANAVRDYLTNMGVSRSRLRTVSFGEERPVSTGAYESSWAKNRRAEFVAKK